MLRAKDREIEKEVQKNKFRKKIVKIKPPIKQFKQPALMKGVH